MSTVVPRDGPRGQPRKTVLELFDQQIRIVVALMIREIFTRFGRKNIGFMWMLLEPTMFAFAVVAMWGMIGNHTRGGIQLAPFLLTGYMPLTLYRHMVGMLMRSMQSNAPLLYHRQITVLSIYMSRVMVEFLGASAAFVFCLTVTYIAGFAEPPAEFGTMVGGWFLYAWFSASLGMLMGGLSERSELVDKIWTPLSYISIPISGTFFMLNWVPDKYRDLLTWVPQINGVEMIRGGYYGISVTTYFDPLYLAYCNAILLTAALWAVLTAREHVEML